MDTNWGRAIRFVMKEQGGSKLTIDEHNAFRRSNFDPDLGDVLSASQQEIETIYRISYWMPYAPVLPSGVDLFYFDTAVIEGVPDALKGLQRALKVDPDGHVGVVTTEALLSIIRTRKVADVLDRYAAERMGEEDRTARVLAVAKDMIRY
jgi:lysozyme family protein